MRLTGLRDRRVRQGYNTSMARRYELPVKTFDKGRRPRLTGEGRKAARRLRIVMIIVVIFFTALGAWLFQDRAGGRGAPPAPAATGETAPSKALRTFVPSSRRVA
jgi:hypothetical protein